MTLKPETLPEVEVAFRLNVFGFMASDALLNRDPGQLVERAGVGPVLRAQGVTVVARGTSHICIYACRYLHLP